MASVAVGTTPVQITNGQASLVQNLGPGVVYVGSSNLVTPANGFILPQGRSISTTATALWAVSDTSAEVRNAAGASGIY